MKVKFAIQPMIPADWEWVRNIYVEGMSTGIATFETEIPDWETWDTKHLRHSRLVAKRKTELVGWAALTPASDRPVYRGVAEVKVYVALDFHRQGIGRSLLDSLVESSEKNGIWTLQSAIFVENVGSINLHKKCGFNIVGIRPNLGKHPQSGWHDIALMERRSTVTGVD